MHGTDIDSQCQSLHNLSIESGTAKRRPVVRDIFSLKITATSRDVQADARFLAAGRGLPLQLHRARVGDDAAPHHAGTWITRARIGKDAVFHAVSLRSKRHRPIQRTKAQPPGQVVDGESLRRGSEHQPECTHGQLRFTRIPKRGLLAERRPLSERTEAISGTASRCTAEQIHTMASNAKSNFVGCRVEVAHGAIFDNQAAESGISRAARGNIGGSNEGCVTVLDDIDFILDVVDLFDRDALGSRSRIGGSLADWPDAKIARRASSRDLTSRCTRGCARR